MKLEDCVKGKYVLARNKTILSDLETFLDYSPLGIGFINGRTRGGTIEVLPVGGKYKYVTFTFYPSDLIELEGD